MNAMTAPCPLSTEALAIRFPAIEKHQWWPVMGVGDSAIAYYEGCAISCIVAMVEGDTRWAHLKYVLRDAEGDTLATKGLLGLVHVPSDKVEAKVREEKRVQWGKEIDEFLALTEPETVKSPRYPDGSPASPLPEDVNVINARLAFAGQPVNEIKRPHGLYQRILDSSFVIRATPMRYAEYAKEHGGTIWPPETEGFYVQWNAFSSEDWFEASLMFDQFREVSKAEIERAREIMLLK